MRRHGTGWLILAIPLLLLFSCSRPQEKGRVLEEQEMSRVLFDMLQADAFHEHFILSDSLHKRKTALALQDQLFSLHHITRDDFRVSYRYYSDRPRQMSRILDSLLARAEHARSALMMERYSGSKAPVEQAGE